MSKKEAKSKPTRIFGAGNAIKPPQRKGCEAVRYAFHNPETGAYLGRTPKSWLLIITFYLLFYSCLAGYWYGCLNVFFLTLNNDEPKWKAGRDSCCLSKSPGLGLKPAQVDKFMDSSLISFNMDAKQDQGKPGDENYVPGYQGWVNRTRDFLDRYANQTHCGQYCFNLEQLGVCGSEPYGYDEGKPCVYLKLNKVFGLENEMFDELPKDMPETLKEHINAQDDKNQVWVECHGDKPADKEWLGEIKYYPESQGFPAKYFPFKNQKGYQSPLVAVQFSKASHRRLLRIECRAWAANIGYNRIHKIGVNHLDLLILDEESTQEVGQSKWATFSLDLVSFLDVSVGL